jgi:periplasmic divalent cation tolerance protein
MPIKDEAMNPDACIVLVTCGSQEEAAKIAEAVVTEHLAACVNIVGADHPIQSFYFWEGSLQQDQEYLLILKTLTARLGDLGNRVRELHSYTVPEFIAMPIMAGSYNYLEWIRQSVGE